MQRGKYLEKFEIGLKWTIKMWVVLEAPASFVGYKFNNIHRKNRFEANNY